MARLTHRRSWQTRCAVMTAAAMLVGCSTTEPEIDDGGLIGNGGFELPGPQMWVPISAPRASQYHTIAVDSTEAHGGRRSAMIRIHADHPSNVFFYNWFQPVVAGFETGRSYVLEAWGKTSDVAVAIQVFVEVRFYDVNNTQMGREWAPVPGTSPSSGSPSEWKRLTIPMLIPDGTVVMNIRAGITAPFNAGGTVWFDDFRLVPSGGMQ